MTRDGELFLRRYELTVRPLAGSAGAGAAGATGVAVDVVARPLLAQAHHTVTGPTTPRERGPETVWKLQEERAEWRVCSTPFVAGWAPPPHPAPD